MFPLYLLPFSLLHIVLAAPLIPQTGDVALSMSGDAMEILPRGITQGADEQRSLLSIFWSCMATITACTWIAIHPNIPDPNLSMVAVATQRLRITIYALLAPEVVIMWAMRQWYGARRIEREYKGILSYLTIYRSFTT